jgi:Bacteriophage HK97-gp10, putative tail-component
VLKIDVDLREIERGEELFRNYPRVLRPRLLQAIRDSSAKLLALIKEKLSGIALNVRTGNLRRSWHVTAPVDSGDGVGYSGGAGSNADYAAYQEFGFHGTEHVRAFSRSQKSRNVYARTERGGRAKVASGLAFVREHDRNVNYAGRPYARPSLEEAAPFVQEYHEQAVRDAAEELQ